MRLLGSGNSACAGVGLTDTGCSQNGHRESQRAMCRGQKRGSEGFRPRSGNCGCIAAPGREKSLPAVGQAHNRPLLHPHAVLLVLSLQFGLSLLYLVLSRGEELQNSSAATELMQDNQW